MVVVGFVIFMYYYLIYYEDMVVLFLNCMYGLFSYYLMSLKFEVDCEIEWCLMYKIIYCNMCLSL